MSSVEIMDYGAAIVNLAVPNRKGELGYVSLGLESVEPYLTVTTYFGDMIGRYCNRIAGGRFELDGREYQLPKNDYGNSLHGGDAVLTNKCGRRRI